NDKAFKTMSESKDLIIKDLIDLKLYDIDEIYAVNIIQFINIVNILYKSIPCCYIEESAFGTFSKGHYQNVQKFIMPTYLDKIDNRGFSDSEKNKFVNLKSEYFIQVADECVKMYPLNIDCAPEDKIIIFCGTWGDLQCYTESEFAQKEEEIIEKLQNKGFVVYFKPHPRDNREYKETANFKILKTKLPLECYVINNLVATVSLLSFSSLQSFHYRKVPGFVCLNYFELKDEKALTLLSEYTPSVDLILDINTNEYSLQALKNEVTRRYLDFLNSKPMLSKNATFDKFNK
ncbi:hypothetical protein IJD34_07435, partial [bacterium]|nr:hypothetical protein [bacterium]